MRRYFLILIFLFTTFYVKGLNENFFTIDESFIDQQFEAVNQFEQYNFGEFQNNFINTNIALNWANIQFVENIFFVNEQGTITIPASVFDVILGPAQISTTNIAYSQYCRSQTKFFIVAFVAGVTVAVLVTYVLLKNDKCNENGCTTSSSSGCSSNSGSNNSCSKSDIFSGFF